ncbi:ATPase family associated with various cellular activities (AAA), putative [Trypanosoma equiperdum]|uniref:Chromosome transmission fidelity protein 18 homolog n=1 Tax=Trypanosoma equiperdum TaxID=5694 RepID=A0A1G4I9F9_TRYEQ|nr:ATPase family associated with various cellular activities (AAA), putative [Trypanosoma equiperdum]
MMDIDCAEHNDVPKRDTNSHNNDYDIEDEFESIDESLLHGVPYAHDAAPELPDPPKPESAILMSKGVCLLPSCTRVNFMMRGDNGELRWLTASGLQEISGFSNPDDEASKEQRRREQEEEAIEAEGMRANALGLQKRVAGSGLGFVNVATLHRQIFNEDVEAAAVKDCGAVQPRQQEGEQRRGPLSEEDSLWVIKYTPKRFRDLLSDDTTNLKLLQWMKSWDEYTFRNGASPGADGLSSSPSTRPDDRIAVLVGPPGVGKTTLAHVLALHCGYEPIEINASVDRTASGIESAIQLAVSPGRSRRRVQRPAVPTSNGGNGGSATSLVDMLMLPKCLIIDEMDGIAANFASFLLKQDIHCPVLCLCNDYYVPSLRLLRQQCRLVFHVPPIRPQRLLQRLGEIAEHENIKVADAVLAELVRASNGDVRCCLNTLQFAYRCVVSDTGETPQQQHKRQQDLLREMQGKDMKLNLWDMWRVVLERQDRSKYVQLLRKEFAMNYDAVVMAGCANPLPLSSYQQTQQLQVDMDVAEEGYVATGFRVDPGYTYVSRVLQWCDDTNGLLDGLHEFYLRRSYTDYSFQNTCAVSDAFSFQDCLTTTGYRHTPLLPFAEQYGKSATATSCFSCCSAMGRGSSITASGFPRAAATAARRRDESFHITRMVRDNCRSLEVASHLYSTTAITEVVPSLLRCLCDVSLHIPSHTVASGVGLTPKDQQLLRAAVARHALYGFTYVRTTRGRPGNHRRGSDEPDHVAEEEEHWELDPPIHRICCASLSEAQQERMPGQRPAVRDTSSSSVMVLHMKEEVKQLLVGEIHRHIIQTSSLRAVRNHGGARKDNTGGTDEIVVKRDSTLPSRKRERDDEIDGREIKVKKEEEKFSGVPKPADGMHGTRTGVTVKREEDAAEMCGCSPQAEGPKAAVSAALSSSKPAQTVLKDFFGRPIAAKPKGMPLAFSKAKGENVVDLSNAGAHGRAKKLTVQYIYKEGCTNGVKIPASLNDF